jgi:hypothetical protein
MTMKEKLLVLWVFVMVIVAFVVTHIASHLAFVLESCFALILPVKTVRKRMELERRITWDFWNVSVPCFARISTT